MVEKKLIKLLIVTPDLGLGGTQGYVTKLEHDISPFVSTRMVVLTGQKTTNKYKYLRARRVLFSIWSLYIYLKKIRPNQILAVMDHTLLAVVAANLFTRSKTKIIYRPSSIPSVMSEYYKMGRLRLKLEKILMKYFVSKIVYQSSDQAKEYNTHKEHIVIGNYCEPPISYTASDKIKILSIGRLSPEKGYSRIFKVLSKIADDFEYHIFGTGNHEKDLLKEIHDFKLAKHVKMRGFSPLSDILKEPWTCFIQGSYVEAFPNALLEVLSSGMPALCFPALGGTKEISASFPNCFMISEETFTKDFKAILSYKNQLRDNRNDTQFSKENYIKRFAEFLYA